MLHFAHFTQHSKESNMNYTIKPTITLNRVQIQQVVQTARFYDIAVKSTPEAIFDPLCLGFNIWCTPIDNPGGDWQKIVEHMNSGIFTKPCEFVATVYAEWDDEVENVVAMSLSTDAYALADHLPQTYINSSRPRGNLLSIHNRTEDIAWAKTKTAWLFQQAGVPCPPIVVEEE